jgi:hypothetical protein
MRGVVLLLREWCRPPRHVLTIFLCVAVVSAGALGWLSWLLVAQDRALDVQRRQEHLEQAADRATALMQGALADLERRLTSPSSRASESPPGVVIVVTGPTGIIEGVSPDGGLLYYPETALTPALDSPTALFIEAERAEFARRDLVAAADLFTRLASDADPADTAVRAGALAGLARVLRKAQHPDAALAAYDELAALSDVRVAGLPAGLVARTGRARVLEDTGHASALRDEGAQLGRELRGGRWRLTRSQYQFYSAEALLILPGYRGHPRRRENAPGGVHGQTTATTVHRGVQAGGGPALPAARPQHRAGGCRNKGRVGL